MARYYFNLRYGPSVDKLALDPEGDEIADAGEVRARALRAARDLIDRTRSDVVRNWFDCRFEITDANGRPVLTLPFAEVVSDEDESDPPQFD